MRLIKTDQFFVVLLDGFTTCLKNLFAFRWFLSLISAIILSSSLAFLLLYFYSRSYAIPYTATLTEFSANISAFVLVSFFHFILIILFLSFPLISGYLPGFSLLSPRRFSTIYLGYYNKFSILTIGFGAVFPGAFFIFILYLFVAKVPIFPTIILLPLVVWSGVGFVVYWISYRKRMRMVGRFIEKINQKKKNILHSKEKQEKIYLLSSAYFYKEALQFAFPVTIFISLMWIISFFYILAITFGDDDALAQFVLGTWAILIIFYFPMLIHCVHIHKVLPGVGIAFIAFIYFFGAPGATGHTSAIMKQMNVGGEVPITVTLKPNAIFKEWVNKWGAKDRQRQLFLLLLGKENIFVSEMDNHKCDEVKGYVKFVTDRCQRTYSIPRNYVESLTMYAPRRERMSRNDL